MALVYHFTPKSMTSKQYEECISRLAAAGVGSSSGRLYHASYGPDDRLHVFDIWDSEQSFLAFGETLMPILEELGIDPGDPEVSALHNVIVGS